jgi:hypothetical protein
MLLLQVYLTDLKSLMIGSGCVPFELLTESRKVDFHGRQYATALSFKAKPILNPLAVQLHTMVGLY